jgi:transcription initiation factor IIE alpha subunit
MTHTCPKCGAKIVVETDDRKQAEKWIEKCDKELKAFNQELEEMVKRLA